jgi:hypothetical protein
VKVSAIIKGAISLFILVLCSSCVTGSKSKLQPEKHSNRGKYISLEAIAKSHVRTLEELQIAFDRRSAQFYALVNEHLQRRPGSGGQLMLSITVEPDGTISECHLVASTLSDSTLEQAVLSEVRRLNAGARAVPTATFPSYPIHVSAQ